MGYYVYFDTIDAPYNGWLNISSNDLTLYGHFMNYATKFKTKDEALLAANDHLSKLHAVCDGLKKEDKTNYKFWILEMVENGGNEQ